MYIISKLTGKIYLNNVEIIQDDRLQYWQTMRQWQIDGGVFEEVDYAGNELNEINAPLYEKEIVSIYSMLCERALRSSMGKGYEYDTYQKLKQQQEEYAEMYAVSIGISTEQTVIDGIQDEIDMDFPLEVLEAELISYGITPTGSHLEKMYQLIKFKYEYGEVIYNIYIRYAVSFRKKSRSWVASSLWSKLDAGFNIARSIPLELSTEESETFFNQFAAL